MINVKDLEAIGQGGYGCVYQLSKTTVVKVFHKNRHRDENIVDEIEGSKRPGCLPVLDTIKVIDSQGTETIGLVKEYLPTTVDWDDQDYREFRQKYEYWDDHVKNFRRDSNGKIYLCDTQMDPD